MWSRGDLELEKCAGCGGPKLLSHCQWDLDMGIITNKQNGYRMTIFGPGLMDTVFEALEWELGETTPTAVVEAQRLYVRSGFQPIDFSQGKENLRTQLAFRGLGNLREFEMDKRGAFLHLDNACFFLLIAGLLQGSFEKTFHVDSEVEWEVSKGDSLRVEVKARA